MLWDPAVNPWIKALTGVMVLWHLAHLAYYVVVYG